MKKRMMKKIVSFALAMVMVLTSVLIGGVEVVKAATPEEVTIKNANFETDVWSDGNGWTITSSTWDGGTQFELFSYSSDSYMNAPEGSTTALKYYLGAEGTFVAKQTINALPAGKYTITVPVMGTDSSVKVSLGNDSSDAVSLTGYNNWHEVVGIFTIDEDTTNVELKIEGTAASGAWGYIDSVKLVGETIETGDSTEQKTFNATDKVVNGDFETDEVDGIEGWTVVTENASMTCQDKTDTYANNNKTNMVNYSNNNSATASFSMSQTITGLEAGTYKLALQQEGAAGTSGLSVKVSGTTVNVSKALPATTGWDVWATVETDEFTLTSAEDVTITISGNVVAGYWGDFDNVVLYKADASGSTTNPDGGSTTNPDGGSTTNPDGGSTTNPDGGSTTNPEGGSTTTPETEEKEEKKVDEKPVVIELDNSNFTSATDGTWTGEIAKGEWQNGNDMQVLSYSSDSYLELPDYVGTTGLKFNMEQGNTMTISQWVDSLKAGTYTITAPVMGENTDVYLVLGDKEIKATSLSGYNSWTKAKATFKITEDMADVKVGFKLVATSSGDNSWSWGWIDSIQLIKTVPGTGDASNIYAYVMLMMVGVALVGYSVKRNKVQF